RDPSLGKSPCTTSPTFLLAAITARYRISDPTVPSDGCRWPWRFLQCPTRAFSPSRFVVGPSHPSTWLRRRPGGAPPFETGRVGRLSAEPHEQDALRHRG